MKDKFLSDEESDLYMNTIKYEMFEVVCRYLKSNINTTNKDIFTNAMKFYDNSK